MSVHNDTTRSGNARKRFSLRQRAASALQRSISCKPLFKLPAGRADAARIARVEAAIASLPPITREVFILHRFDGLVYEGIAHRLGISVEEVTSHMAEAILHLHLELRDMT